jgi:hypothetical protein
MTAKSGRSAQLDCAHRAALDPPEMPLLRLPIGLAVVTQDIRHLQSRRHGDAGSV